MGHLNRVLALLALLTLPACTDVQARPDPVSDCREAIARGVADAGRPLPHVFGLLSWNIRKGLDSGWEKDLDRLMHSAHLIFLQEARPGPRLDRMLVRLPYRYFAPGFSLAGRPTGVMTASTEASALHCSLRSSEPWLGTPKAAGVTLHAVGMQRRGMLAINLHGINLSIGTRVFRQQLDMLEPLLRAHNGPVILGGDLNAWSPARLAVVDQLAARHGLRRENFQPDLRSRIVGLAMDHIYLRGLDTVLAEALPVTTSDHNPLLLKLALSRAE